MPRQGLGKAGQFVSRVSSVFCLLLLLSCPFIFGHCSFCSFAQRADGGAVDHQALDRHSSDATAQQISSLPHHFDAVDHPESPRRRPAEDQKYHHSIPQRYVHDWVAFFGIRAPGGDEALTGWKSWRARERERESEKERERETEKKGITRRFINLFPHCPKCKSHNYGNNTTFSNSIHKYTHCTVI